MILSGLMLSILILGLGQEQNSPVQPGISGAVEASMRGPENDPMHLPSQVLALKDGRYAVLDGANNRMAFFNSAGDFECYTGREGHGPGAFGNPLGFCTGPGHTLIVADTGNSRLQVLDSSGSFVREVDLKSLVKRSRPTGVAANLKQGRLYVTDSAAQAVHILSMPTFELIESISIDRSPEGFDPYPLSPRIDSESLLVVEPLSGRIRRQHLGLGEVRFIGGYGLAPGSLFRPKGLALDPDGFCFVSDSWQNKIAVYSNDASFLGWLENGQGAPLEFEMPWGLAFDAENRLLVVEMEKNCITVVSIREGSGGSHIPSAPDAPKNRQAKNNGKDEPACTICHPDSLPWWSGMPGQSDEPDPVKPAGSPRICLTCHDGSITDDRSSVFREHSHLAYARQENTCMTCHQAHGDEPAVYAMEHAIFSRLPGPRSKACRICHTEKFETAENQHFMGILKKPIPERLVQAGAAPPEGAEGPMECRSCHLAHGARDGNLLVSGPEGPCETCHDEVRHAWDPHAKQRLFSCLTCHSTHHGRSEALLKAEEKISIQSCTVCHEDKAGLYGSKHDLADQNGSCLVCHLSITASADRPVLWRFEAGLDESTAERRCTVCHGRDRLYGANAVAFGPHRGERLPAVTETSIDEDKDLRAVDLDCVACHNPHGGDRAFVVPDLARRLCTPCHGPEGLWHYLHYHHK